MKVKDKKLEYTTIAIVVIAIAGFVIASIILHIQNQDKFAKGVVIANTEIGGLSYFDGLAKIENKIDDFETATVDFKVEGEDSLAQASFEAAATLDELGVSLNLEKALGEAFEVGKNKSVFREIYEDYLALFGKYEHDLQYEIDYEKLDFFFEDTIRLAETPVQNASLKANADGSLEVIPDKIGYVVPKDELYGGVYESVATLDDTPIEVPLEPELPKIQTDDLDDAQKKAQWLMSQDFYLNYGGNYWTVGQSEIYEYLLFEPEEVFISNQDQTDEERAAKEINRKVLDTFFKEDNETVAKTETVLRTRLGGEKLESLLYEIRNAISVDAQNARFQPVKGEGGSVVRVQSFQLAQNGVTLDEAQTVANINSAVDSNENEAVVAAKIIEPEFTDNQASIYGIETLLGRSSLPLLNSPANRRHNIEVGASKLSGIIVKPGEQVSFNNSLGEVSLAEGFRSELVIKQNEVVPELGGGLCHVSSSLFQATTNAGLQIDERQNHSFHVEYYGDTPGYDATIYPPAVDFKFTNNTENNILIMGFIESDALVFEVYGTDDGREVFIDGPHAYDWQSDGAVKAWLGYTVTRNGTILQDKKFVSSYKSPSLFSH